MRRFAGPLAAAALAAALYLPGLGGEFIQDDKHAIVMDPRVERIGVSEAFTTPYWNGNTWAGLYRPLARLSWSVDFAFAGRDPRFFRFGNLLLYAALTCAATVLFQSLLGARAGFLAGALFAVHPVHTEAVLQAVGRAELIAALGALVALLCHRRGWTVATAAAYAVSLFSKETAAALPALLVVHDVTLARRPFASAVRRALPCVVVLAAFLGARWAVLGTPLRPPPGPHELATPDNPLNRQFPLGHLGFLERLPVVRKVLAVQFRLLVWPHPLRAEYPLEALDAPAAGLVGLAGLALLVTGAACLRGAPQLACGWFLLAWLPISHLLLPIGTVFGERLLLFPSLAFALGAGAAIRRWPRTGGAVALAVAVAGAALTVRRIPDWRTERGLWEATVVTTPQSARAWFNVGRTRYEARDLDGAERGFREALTILPRMEPAEMHLGLVASDRGRFDEAEAHFTRALEWYPRYADAMFNRGRNHLMAGRRAEARIWIERALRENPADPLYQWGLREVSK